MNFDDIELMQLQFCMQQTKNQMSMGGEIRRHASITQKIEEEMKLRKEKTGAYTPEGVSRDLQKQLSKLKNEFSN
jgi:hypothetical protein